MRILVVSDIHANWPALAAIDEPHDFAICLGDLVDYGPNPLECVRWAMAHARHSIRGNHDHGVAQGVSVAGRDRLSLPDAGHTPPDVGGPGRRGTPVSPPTPAHLPVHGRRPSSVPARAWHSQRPARRIPDASDPETWAKRLVDCDADVVCVGHSHMQFNLRAGSSVVINPGSVGNPRDGDPRAAYAVIENNKVELKRVAYPGRGDDRPPRSVPPAREGQGDVPRVLPVRPPHPPPAIPRLPRRGRAVIARPRVPRLGLALFASTYALQGVTVA